MADNQGALSWLASLFSSPPKEETKTYLAPPRSEYPTDDDVNFARKNDWSYGQPWAPEFEGHSARLLSGITNKFPLKTEVLGTDKKTVDKLVPGTTDPLKDYYAKAALASEGSALSKLGFDPNRTAVDLLRDPKKTDKTGRYVYGFNEKNEPVDDIYANARDPSAIVHESMHRGFKKLRESPFWKPEFDEMYPKEMNEHLVRHLMHTKMGDPEASDFGAFSQADQAAAEILFNRGPDAARRQKLADQIEAAAAQLVAKNRPGGPR